MKDFRKSFFFRVNMVSLIMFFFINSICPSPVLAQAVTHLPQAVSPAIYAPVQLKAIKIRENEPLVFDLVVDSGSMDVQGSALKEETEKLAKYFLAAVTIPEKDLWVNLSPYENDRIIPYELGLTELGRDMLAQDAVLKEMSAAATNPDSPLGRLFWDRVYAKAMQVLGTTEIPMDTFNKIWITPDAAKIYQKGAAAFLGESSLKVMLDQDYVALGINDSVSAQAGGDQVAPEVRALSTQAMKEVLLPEIERMVNTSSEFAVLRQFYGAMILATWYKRALKDSLLGQVYADQKRTAGVNTDDPAEKERIYQGYLKQFRRGTAGFIREEADPFSGETVPRKYFSGGVDCAEIDKKVETILVSGAVPDVQTTGSATQVTIALADPEKMGAWTESVRGLVEQADQDVATGNTIKGLRGYQTGIAQIEKEYESLQNVIGKDAVDRLAGELKVKVVAVMASLLRSVDRRQVVSERKFALYSGPPGGGKGAVWERFSPQYEDLISKFVLFHTRPIRPGEVQDKNYYFRAPEHLERLKAEGKIITTLVNNQPQGLALKTFEDTYVDPVSGETQTVTVKGLDQVFAGADLVILEGGLGWFEELHGQYGNKLASIFISPFDEKEMAERARNAVFYKGAYEKAVALHAQEELSGAIMPQKEFDAQTKAAGEGFRSAGIQLSDGENPEFFVAAYETALRIHKREVSLQQLTKHKNYVERTQEAATQVLRRNEYQSVLVNEFQDSPEGFVRMMDRLSTEFAYTVFSGLIEDIITQIPGFASQAEVPVGNALSLDVDVQGTADRAQASVNAGDLWGAYKQYRDALNVLTAAKKAGKPVDGELAALKARAVEIMADIVRHTDLGTQESQLKFGLYSGPPAGGKGDIWKEFSRRYGDIVDSFKLFHTRGIRAGEAQGRPWNFRVESHLKRLEKQHLILTALVNNQIQGMPLQEIKKNAWRFFDEDKKRISGVTDVEGLDDVFKGAKIRVLEGGFGWFLTLMDKEGYEDIATVFISPFSEQQIAEFETQGSRYKAMFEKTQKLYAQEVMVHRLMSQEEFVRAVEEAGNAAANDPFTVEEIAVNGFKVGQETPDWPGFRIRPGVAADKRSGHDLQVKVPADGLFYAAAYETAKRLHGRQWKSVKNVNGDFTGKTPKDLGWANEQNYKDRAYEAAVQVHTRNSYRTVLVNAYQADEVSLREQMRHLTDDFAYTIFDALLQKIDLEGATSYVQYAQRYGMSEADVNALWEKYELLNSQFSFAGFLDAVLADKRQEYFNSRAGGGISDIEVRNALNEQGALDFFDGDLNEALLKMKQWQQEFKSKLGRDVTIREMLTTDPDVDSSFELFQVLDADGKMLNEVKPRALVHHDGDWHRDVRIIVLDPTGKNIFLQKRGEKKDMEPGLLADSIGGHTRIGETYNENAVREAKEELGFDVDTNRLFRLGGGYAIHKDDINNGLDGAKRQINRSHYAAYIYQLNEQEMGRLNPAYADGITPAGIISRRFFELAGMDAERVMQTLENNGIIVPLKDGDAGYLESFPQWTVVPEQAGRVKDLFAASDAEVIDQVFGLGTGWISTDTFRKIGQQHPQWVVDSINKGFQPEGIYQQWFDADKSPVGGIDLNASLLDMTVEKTGDDVRVFVDPALIDQIRMHGVKGFSPVVINMVPMANVMEILK